MSELTPLREAVDTLARRAPSPDFGQLKRRATRRGRRRVATVAAVTAAVIAGSVLAITGVDHRRTAPRSSSPSPPRIRTRSSPMGTCTAMRRTPQGPC